MVPAPSLANHLSSHPDLTVTTEVPLSEHTRFGIGGPAAVYVETASESGFVEALRCVQSSLIPYVVIGSGTNLVVSDSGFPGVVLRFTGSEIRHTGARVWVAAGAMLQDLVDYTVTLGLTGIHTMTGIPGSVGAAVYGNAGAYGRAIDQSIREVRFFDGGAIRVASNDDCRFRYRDSIFKRNKPWIILSALLELEGGDAAELINKSAEILSIRNRKYPPTMKCAGSIFKNLLLMELPENVRSAVPERTIIEGKVPAAWFLEQVGAKGMTNGDIRVADYHANLIYNENRGTAAQLREVIGELKRRVTERYGFVLEEEVQYIGFD
jgi:UDP-N-acetylmuramate dehydrogenase